MRHSKFNCVNNLIVVLKNSLELFKFVESVKFFRNEVPLKLKISVSKAEFAVLKPKASMFSEDLIQINYSERKPCNSSEETKIEPNEYLVSRDSISID